MVVVWIFIAVPMNDSSFSWKTTLKALKTNTVYLDGYE